MVYTVQTITPAEWRAHKERGTYHVMIDGTKAILEWSDKGTTLVPVRVMEPTSSCCTDGTFGLYCKCENNNNNETGV